MTIKVIPFNVYLIEIKIPIAYMPVDNYTQWASKGPGDRFYINRKGRGGMSIGVKSVDILAQKIWYYDTDAMKYIQQDNDIKF